MLDENKYLQYGVQRSTGDILGITIHESSNINDTAEDLMKWYNTECKSNTTYHYVVDSKGFQQLMPDDYALNHVGKYASWGDLYTIAIEICTTLSDEKFNSTLQNTIYLIKLLQETYNISDKMIFFHNDFNDRVYCPKTLLNKYGTAKIFVMEELQGG